MTAKTIYLDTFALVKISTDPILMSASAEYIRANSYTLIIGIMNLMEIYGWRKRWPQVSEFISSVPFCIAENPEKITAREIENYPNKIDLPVAFCSSDYAFSQLELQNAIELNLEEKIASFEKKYRAQYKETLDSILSGRDDNLPDEHGKYSDQSRWVYMQINVLKFLFPDYKAFVDEKRAKSEFIQIECIKSAYLQALIIFQEYYVQRKAGKLSDIGDIYQLAIIPYIDLAVIDNERNDLVQRINRNGLFPAKLNACNLSQFKKIVTAK